MDSEAVLESRNLRQSSQMDSWQTVFVFRDQCVERVDTPALEMLLETYASETDTPALEMLLETYASETDKPADRAAVVQERPIELDRAQAKKERKRARDKAYQKLNAVHIKAQSKAFRAANAVKIKARHKEYQNVNAVHIKAQRKAFRAANAVKIKAQKKAYYAANTVKINDQNKAYRAKNTFPMKDYHKAYRAANIVQLKDHSKVYYQNNAARIIANNTACKLRNHGCIRCIEWPVDQQVGLPHYDGYCFRCFCDEFPHDERVKNRGRVELRVRAYLNSHFAGFVHDHVMPTAHCVCDHRRRIDHRREVGNTLLCIETDEHHHRNYDKDDESARYHDMLMGWGGKLCFIRFNPDGKGPPLEDRLERLHAEITRHIGRLERGENSAFLEVWHLYYPEGTEDYCGESIAPEGL